MHVVDTFPGRQSISIVGYDDIEFAASVGF
jgi:hypothetical protein